MNGKRAFPGAAIDMPTPTQPNNGRREHAADIGAGNQIVSKPLRLPVDRVVKIPLACSNEDGENQTAGEKSALARSRDSPVDHTPNLNRNTGDCQTR